MIIRKLEKKDAKNMLECFQDKDNVKYLQIGYVDMKIEDCEKFISNSFNENNIHFAIVDENDEWCGTISLKNIDYKNLKAEYAIVTSKRVQGKGLAYKATLALRDYAFNELKLNKIYLNVIVENERAFHFYEKCGFNFIGETKKSVNINGTFHNLKWYEMLNELLS